MGTWLLLQSWQRRRSPRSRRRAAAKRNEELSRNSLLPAYLWESACPERLAVVFFANRHPIMGVLTLISVSALIVRPLKTAKGLAHLSLWGSASRFLKCCSALLV